MSDGFAKVKAAFESTYKCMGVTCEDIGGLWLTEDYYDGAAPCKSEGHDDHDDHDSADNSKTASASVDLKPTPILGALLLAQMALLHHA
jgi:hypothetical protein